MLSGWSDVTIVAEQILASKEHETNGVIVADNYYLAVQLAFWSKRKSGIYNLDDEGINQTGRAAQRAIWELDEAGLRRNHAGKNALVVIDTRSIAGGNREVFFERLCGIFEQLHPVLTYGMFGNAWEYKFFIGEGIKSTLAVGRVEHRVTKSSSRVSC